MSEYRVSIFDLERLAGLRGPDMTRGDGFFGYGIVVNTVIRNHNIKLFVLKRHKILRIYG